MLFAKKLDSSLWFFVNCYALNKLMKKFVPTSTTQGFVGVRVAMAVCCAMQYATQHSTA